MSDYVQPVGEADPNASYKDRNTGAGEPGSRVPALAIEMPQREIRTVLVAAGLTPDKTDPTQLNAAIDAKIALATSSGPDPVADLLNLLRARMLVYPEIMTSDGRFNLSTPATGTVRIPSGITLRHRGCFDEVTAQQDFTTVANKTYHLRKRWTGGLPGWALVDVSNSAYNPTALAEADVSFDTTYDDMISHRVVTNASNVATITALANRDRLQIEGTSTVTRQEPFEENVTADTAVGVEIINVTLARRPKVAIRSATDIDTQLAGVTFNEMNFGVRANSRYSISCFYQNKMPTGAGYGAYVSYEVWL